MTRRAVRKLRGANLIYVPEGRTIRVTQADNPALLQMLGRKYAVVRAMWRTPLGEAVVEQFRAELEGGGRIRWLADAVDAIRESAVARCPNR